MTTTSPTSPTPSSSEPISPPSDVDVLAELLSRRRARKSLLGFTNRFSIEAEPAKHHLILLDRLQRLLDGEFNRLMVLMPPGGAKSTYASQLTPGYVLSGGLKGRGRRVRVIGTSHTAPLAAYFGERVQNIVNSPAFYNTFEFRVHPRKKATHDWRTTAGGEYFAAGVGGALPGRRAHIALIDDPIKSHQEAKSQTHRDMVWDWYVTDLRPRLIPHAPIVLIQTRWHWDDPAGRILPEDYDHSSGFVKAQDGETWYVLNICALTETRDDVERDILGRGLNESYWPGWFSDDLLMQERNSQGPRNWSALYQQRPTPEEGEFFMEDMFRWYNERPAFETLQIYGASDYAVEDTEKHDYTVHGIIGVDPNDDIYILDWWRGRTEPDVWAEVLLSYMDHWLPIEWAEEKGQIQKGIGPFLTKRMRESNIFCYRHAYISSQDKPTRVQAFRARMVQGKVYFPRKAPWMNDLKAELLTFPYGKHDDQVDVLSLFGRMLARMLKGRPPPPPPPEVTTVHDVTMDRLWKDQDKRRSR